MNSIYDCMNIFGCMTFIMYLMYFIVCGCIHVSLSNPALRLQDLDKRLLLLLLFFVWSGCWKREPLQRQRRVRRKQSARDWQGDDTRRRIPRHERPRRVELCSTDDLLAVDGRSRTRRQSSSNRRAASTPARRHTDPPAADRPAVAGGMVWPRIRFRF